MKSIILNIHCLKITTERSGRAGSNFSIFTYLCVAEIGHFDNNELPSIFGDIKLADKNVLGLEISMNHLLLMQILHSLGNLQFMYTLCKVANHYI
jgi:hypothetical protein